MDSAAYSSEDGPLLPIRPNPLIGGATMSSLPLCHRISLGLGFVLLAPLRLAGIGIALVAVHIVLGLGYCWCLRKDHSTTALPAWRRACVRCGYRCVARGALCAAGYPPCGCIQVEGRENLTRAARDSSEVPIVVCNHLGLIEPVLLDWLIGGAVVVAEQKTTKHWYLSAVQYAKQAIGFNRSDRSEAKAVGASLIQRARDEKGQWNQVLIFPEGTCGNGRGLAQFKVGAFAAGTPVLPVVVEFPLHERDAPWERHGASVPFEAWVYGNDSGTAIYMRVLARLWNRVRIRILPVHYPTDAEQSNPALFASAVRSEMGAALQIPLTQCSGDDVALMAVAAKVGLPYDEAVLGCAGLWERHGAAARRSALTLHVRAFAAGRRNREVLGWSASDFVKWCAANGVDAALVSAEALRRYFDALVGGRGGGGGGGGDELRLRNYIGSIVLPDRWRGSSSIKSNNSSADGTDLEMEATHRAVRTAALRAAREVDATSLTPPPSGAATKVAPVVRTPSPTEVV